jgi:hypothetical protein
MVRKKTRNIVSSKNNIIAPEIQARNVSKGTTNITTTTGNIYIMQNPTTELFLFRTSSNNNWTLIARNEIIGIKNVGDNTPVIVFFETDFYINSNNNTYFVCNGSNITIEGNNRTVYVSLFFGGLVSNIGQNNITLQNIIVSGINNSLTKLGGWIARMQFSGINCKIINCGSNGDITEDAGGIVGAYASSGNILNSLEVRNCYSTGIMKKNSGGIFGAYASSQFPSTTFNLSVGKCIAINCFSIGRIDNGSGGIFGSNASSYSTLFTNIIGSCIAIDCISIGNIGLNSGGIFGANCNNSHFSATTDNFTIDSGCRAFRCGSNGNLMDRFAGGIFGNSHYSNRNTSLLASYCYSLGTSTYSEGSGGIFSKPIDFMRTNAIAQYCFSIGDIGVGGGIFTYYITNFNEQNMNQIAYNCYTSGRAGIGSGGIYGRENRDNVRGFGNYSEANNRNAGWNLTNANFLITSGQYHLLEDNTVRLNMALKKINVPLVNVFWDNINRYSYYIGTSRFVRRNKFESNLYYFNGKIYLTGRYVSNMNESSVFIYNNTTTFFTKLLNFNSRTIIYNLAYDRNSDRMYAVYPTVLYENNTTEMSNSKGIAKEGSFGLWEGIANFFRIFNTLTVAEGDPYIVKWNSGSLYTLFYKKTLTKTFYDLCITVSRVWATTQSRIIRLFNYDNTLTNTELFKDIYIFDFIILSNVVFMCGYKIIGNLTNLFIASYNLDNNTLRTFPSNLSSNSNTNYTEIGNNINILTFGSDNILAINTEDKIFLFRTDLTFITFILTENSIKINSVLCINNFIYYESGDNNIRYFVFTSSPLTKIISVVTSKQLLNTFIMSSLAYDTVNKDILFVNTDLKISRLNVNETTGALSNPRTIQNRDIVKTDLPELPEIPEEPIIPITIDPEITAITLSAYFNDKITRNISIQKSIDVLEFKTFIYNNYNLFASFDPLSSNNTCITSDIVFDVVKLFIPWNDEKTNYSLNYNFNELSDIYIIGVPLYLVVPEIIDDTINFKLSQNLIYMLPLLPSNNIITITIYEMGISLIINENNTITYDSTNYQVGDLIKFVNGGFIMILGIYDYTVLFKLYTNIYNTPRYNWDFLVQGTDGSINPTITNATKDSNGNIYICGDVKDCGNTASFDVDTGVQCFIENANGIAKYNINGEWIKISKYYPNSPFTQILVDINDNIIVSGAFTVLTNEDDETDTISVNKFAKFNVYTETWTNMGSQEWDGETEPMPVPEPLKFPEVEDENAVIGLGGYFNMNIEGSYVGTLSYYNIFDNTMYVVYKLWTYTLFIKFLNGENKWDFVNDIQDVIITSSRDSGGGNMMGTINAICVDNKNNLYFAGYNRPSYDITNNRFNDESGFVSGTDYNFMIVFRYNIINNTFTSIYDINKFSLSEITYGDFEIPLNEAKYDNRGNIDLIKDIQPLSCYYSFETDELFIGSDQGLTILNLTTIDESINNVNSNYVNTSIKGLYTVSHPKFFYSIYYDALNELIYAGGVGKIFRIDYGISTDNELLIENVVYFGSEIGFNGDILYLLVVNEVLYLCGNYTADNRSDVKNLSLFYKNNLAFGIKSYESIGGLELVRYLETQHKNTKTPVLLTSNLEDWLNFTTNNCDQNTLTGLMEFVDRQIFNTNVVEIPIEKSNSIWGITGKYPIITENMTVYVPDKTGEIPTIENVEHNKLIGILQNDGEPINIVLDDGFIITFLYDSDNLIISYDESNIIRTRSLSRSILQEPKYYTFKNIKTSLRTSLSKPARPIVISGTTKISNILRTIYTINLYIKEIEGIIKYSYDGEIYEDINFPLSIENEVDDIFYVVIENNLNITNDNMYINIMGSNINIDCRGNTINISNVNDYQGFIKNDNNYIRGFENIILSSFIINVNNTNSSLISDEETTDDGIVYIAGGWLCQSGFGLNLENNNCIVKNCFSNGNIPVYGGGLIGSNATVKVIDCYNLGIVGENAGGIIGANAIMCDIQNCYNNASIVSTGGGIAGYNYSGIIKNCYSVGGVINTPLDIPNLNITDNYSIGLDDIWNSADARRILTNSDVWYSIDKTTPFLLKSFNRQIFPNKISLIKNKEITIEPLFIDSGEFYSISKNKNIHIDNTCSIISSRAGDKLVYIYRYSLYKASLFSTHSVIYNYNINLVRILTSSLNNGNLLMFLNNDNDKKQQQQNFKNIIKYM